MTWTPAGIRDGSCRPWFLTPENPAVSAEVQHPALHLGKEKDEQVSRPARCHEQTADHAADQRKECRKASGAQVFQNHHNCIANILTGQDLEHVPSGEASLQKPVLEASELACTDSLRIKLLPPKTM
jgi:hypothetical protein